MSRQARSDRSALVLLLLAALFPGAGCSDSPQDTSGGPPDAKLRDHGPKDDLLRPDGPARDRSRKDKKGPDRSIKDSKPPSPDGKVPQCKTTTTCSASKFCDESLVNTDTFNGIWRAKNGEGFAVGNGGAVAHFNGTKWRPMRSNTKKQLKAVWGSGPKDVWAVGVTGTVIHYDGKAWSSKSAGTSDSLKAVWGSGPKDIYAAGSVTLFRYDGAAWKKVNTGVSGKPMINGIWGSSAKDVFVVGSKLPGYAGVILHFNGAKWVSMPGADSGSYSGLWSVWGSGPKDVWATGYSGKVMHYNGKTWSKVNLPGAGSSILYGVGGTGPKAVYAVGGYNQLFHYDGAKWSNLSPGAKVWLKAVAGVPGGKTVFAAGHAQNYGTVVKVSGKSTSAAYTADYANFSAGWGSGARVVAVGIQPWGSQPLVYERKGTSWTRAYQASHTGAFNAVWGSGPKDIFVVGKDLTPGSNQGLVVHYNGVSWSKLTNTKEHLFGVWGSGPTKVFFVGYWPHMVSSYPSKYEYHGAIHLQHGASGTSKRTWLGAKDEPVVAVWGSGLNNIFAVGGPTYYGTGARVVWRYDGKSWKKLSVPGSGAIRAVWGNGPKDVFMAGDSGTLLRFNGVTFTAMSAPAGANNLRGVWGRGPKEVYAVGLKGTILHFNGSSWKKLSSGVTANLYGVWGGPGEVYATGDDGTILHRCLP